jgi:hypothetical protein
VPSRRRPFQFGLGQAVERGVVQQFIDPGACLGLTVPQEPERPQDAEQVPQRSAPRRLGFARLGLQALKPFAVAGAAQRAVRLLDQRTVIGALDQRHPDLPRWRSPREGERLPEWTSLILAAPAFASPDYVLAR